MEEIDALRLIEDSQIEYDDEGNIHYEPFVKNLFILSIPP